MRQQNDETAADFPPVAARHAFKFLGDIFEIEAFCLAASRALCLILQPGDKIVFIGGRVSGSCHRHSSSCKTCLRERSGWSPRLAYGFFSRPEHAASDRPAVDLGGAVVDAERTDVAEEAGDDCVV